MQIRILKRGRNEFRVIAERPRHNEGRTKTYPWVGRAALKETLSKAVSEMAHRPKEAGSLG